MMSSVKNCVKRCVSSGLVVWAAAAALLGIGATVESRELEIHWIDVEGGAATLIVTPAGESVLIDTGNPGHRDADRIVKQVAAAGLRRLDHVVITHYHRDHFGGAATLAELLPIGTLWDNGKFEGMPDDPGPAYFNLKSERRQVIDPGAAIPLRAVDGQQPLELRCLAARKSFLAVDGGADNRQVCADHRPKDRDGSDNANSVVMLLSYGPFRLFDGGDLTWNEEQRLVCPVNRVGEVDVYQVTHHGLDSSNNPLVLRSLKPAVAIMNNGVTKGCMPEVFANLKESAGLQAIYQVHKNLRPDGAVNNVPDEYIANRESECRANPIRLTVAADAKTYQVSIAANGHTRTYTTRDK